MTIELLDHHQRAARRRARRSGGRRGDRRAGRRCRARGSGRRRRSPPWSLTRCPGRSAARCQRAEAGREKQGPDRWPARSDRYRRQVLLDNGLIRTMDPTNPVTSSLAVSGDRIVAVARGRSDRVDLGRPVRGPRVHRLPRPLPHVGGRPTPGAARGVPVTAGGRRPGPGGGRTGRHRVGGWSGYGWRHADWDDPVEPTRHDLDPVTGNSAPRCGPVTTTRCGSTRRHWRWPSPRTSPPQAGWCPRDDDGGADRVPRRAGGVVVPPPHRHRRRRVRRRHGRGCRRRPHAVGSPRSTTRTAGSGHPGCGSACTSEGALTLRVWQSLPVERLEMLEALGIRVRRRGRVVPPRVPEDVHGRLARFGHGGDARRLGRRDDRLRELVETIRRATVAGWPLAIHAIGDAANRTALDGLAATADGLAGGGDAATDRARPVRRPRRRRPFRLARGCRLGAVLPRPVRPRTWSTGTGRTAPAPMPTGRWPRPGWCWPTAPTPRWRSSTPLAGIVPAVCRTLDDRPPWRPEEALTVEQALAATTVGPAWLAGDEHRRGKLLPGQLADLVVLDADPVTVPRDELPDVSVVATMVGGRWVYRPTTLGLIMHAFCERNLGENSQFGSQNRGDSDVLCGSELIGHGSCPRRSNPGRARHVHLAADVAADDVVVDHPHGLHEGVHRGGTDEAEAAPLQLLGQRHRLRAWSARVTGGVSCRLERPDEGGQACPTRRSRRGRRRALAMAASILPRWRTIDGSPSSRAHVLLTHRRHLLRVEPVEHPAGSRRACAGW